MVSKKAIVPVIFAAIGLVFTVGGMFAVSQWMVWIGLGFWAASVISGRLTKKKSSPKEEPHT